MEVAGHPAQAEMHTGRGSPSLTCLPGADLISPNSPRSLVAPRQSSAGQSTAGSILPTIHFCKAWKFGHFGGLLDSHSCIPPTGRLILGMPSEYADRSSVQVSVMCLLLTLSKQVGGTLYLKRQPPQAGGTREGEFSRDISVSSQK